MPGHRYRSSSRWAGTQRRDKIFYPTVRGTAETRLIPYWNDSKLASSEVDEPLAEGTCPPPPGPGALWHGCGSAGGSAWIAGRVVLLVRVAGFRLPGAGSVTTAMLHRRCPDHGDVPSSWLRRGRCRACLVPVVRERQLGRAAKRPARQRATTSAAATATPIPRRPRIRRLRRGGPARVGWPLARTNAPRRSCREPRWTWWPAGATTGDRAMLTGTGVLDASGSAGRAKPTRHAPMTLSRGHLLSA